MKKKQRKKIDKARRQDTVRYRVLVELLSQVRDYVASVPYVPTLETTLETTFWEPIGTAPKDGRAVLVMRDIWPGTASGRAEECNGHNTYVAEWWTDRWVCYMSAIQDPDCPIEPTHWMPLPPTPKDGGLPTTTDQEQDPT